MMRWLLTAAAVVLTSCTGAKFPPSSPADLEARTVALIQPTGDGEFHAFCSGVWISESTIATARHCLVGLAIGDPIEFMTHGDAYAPGSFRPRSQITARDAVVLAIDDDHDLALLTAQAPPAHPVSHLALTSAMQGARVRTMGMPLELWWSYSSGEISAVRAVPSGDDSYVLCVQTTAPISPGNSGGALFDENGDVVGIAHGYLPEGENLNIFIHVSYLDALVRSTR